MNLRTAAKILTNLHRWPRRVLHRPHTIRMALSVMSRHPTLAERIVCRPEKVHFWGSDYVITPALVYQRFGDGSCWGTVSPLNTRPEYYIVMGDSSWANPDAIWDVLDEIYEAIEEQYGRYDFACDLCGCTGRYGGTECECSTQRGWPALDDDCGCAWKFPCYRAVDARCYRFDKWSRRHA